MKSIRTVGDIDVADKTVLVRVDFNVPFRPGTTEISNDSRIKASLQTIRYLVSQRCRVVVCSHLGRPKGSVVEDLRMAPVAGRLSELLGRTIVEVPDCIGPAVKEGLSRLGPGQVLLLENLRFHPEEEQNSPEFAQALAAPADLYVNDAFGAAHRAHASTVGVTRILPAAAGLLMARELKMLGKVVASPRRPFAAVLGGAKVSDKIGVLENLAPELDVLVIGGSMAATFLMASGINVGDSYVEEHFVPAAQSIIRGAAARGLSLHLPVDVVVADGFSAEASYVELGVEDIQPGWQIMDIGERTAAQFISAVQGSKTVAWNGPMGVFEWEPFAQGTRRIAEALAAMEETTTVIGGGSTAEVVISLGLDGKMTHTSTGGGASLEFLEGKTLPGVAALMGSGEAQDAAF